MDLNELKKKRFLFLKMLYEVTGGDRFKGVSQEDMASELGLDKQIANNIVDYLADEGLIKRLTMHAIGITHEGVVEMEAAISNPEEPTEHFLPVNIINVGQMVNSNIMQDSSHSIQNVNIVSSIQRDDVKKFLAELKENMQNLNLSETAENDISAEISTIESQLTSSKPKGSILKECLSSIRSILEKAAGGVLAHTLITKLLPLLTAL